MPTLPHLPVWGRLREGVPPAVIAAHPPRLARVVEAAAGGPLPQRRPPPGAPCRSPPGTRRPRPRPPGPAWAGAPRPAGGTPWWGTISLRRAGPHDRACRAQLAGKPGQTAGTWLAGWRYVSHGRGSKPAVLHTLWGGGVSTASGFFSDIWGHHHDTRKEITSCFQRSSGTFLLLWESWPPLLGCGLHTGQQKGVSEGYFEKSRGKRAPGMSLDRWLDGWLFVRGWGAPPHPNRLTSDLLTPQHPLLGDQGCLGSVHVPRCQARCLGDRHLPRLTCPRIRRALVRLSPLSRGPGQQGRRSRDLRKQGRRSRDLRKQGRRSRDLRTGPTSTTTYGQA